MAKVFFNLLIPALFFGVIYTMAAENVSAALDAMQTPTVWSLQ